MVGLGSDFGAGFHYCDRHQSFVTLSYRYSMDAYYSFVDYPPERNLAGLLVSLAYYLAGPKMVVCLSILSNR